VARTKNLMSLLVAIANLDHQAAVDLLNATPSLATAGMARRGEFFLAVRLAQVYEGDTASHAAGISYDAEMARDLITRDADIRARNRRVRRTTTRGGDRGARLGKLEPGTPAGCHSLLIEAGADPNAAAAGGVTPTASSELSETDVRLLSRPLGHRCRSSPPKRRLDRVRPRSLDNRARRHGLRSGQDRTTKPLSTCSRSTLRETRSRPAAFRRFLLRAPELGGHSSRAISATSTRRGRGNSRFGRRACTEQRDRTTCDHRAGVAPDRHLGGVGRAGPVVA
jgi:hypothetical protein